MSVEWAGVCRLGGIGDDLITTSVLPGLRAKYGRVEVICQAPFEGVYENNPYVDKLTVKQPDVLPKDGMAWQRWFAEQATHFRFFVNLSHSIETMLAMNQGQTQFYWPATFLRQLCAHNYVERMHEICGIPFEFEVRFYPTEQELDEARRLKEKLGPVVIGWCISGSRLDKSHPYADLAIARLIKELNVPVVMFGAPGRDHELARLVMKHVEENNSSLAGLHEAVTTESTDRKMSPWHLRRSLTQALACDLMIGPDTGPMWAVSAELMPKIMLLSHASKKNITEHWTNTTTLHANPERVPCWPCHKLHDTMEYCTPNTKKDGAACISDISVESIVTAARSALGLD